MTATAIAAIAPAPALPPPDLDKRQLPTISLDSGMVEFLRIHRAVNHPIFYNSTKVSTDVYRFDAPAAQYGVLYCARDFDTCMAETIVRSRFENVLLPLVLTETELNQRCVSALTTDPKRVITLADFTAPSLHLGLSAQLMAHPTYVESTAWSLAVHDHPQKVDGIYFRSRYANAPSIALFEDRVLMVPAAAPVPLLSSAQLPQFLDRFAVDLRP